MLAILHIHYDPSIHYYTIMFWLATLQVMKTQHAATTMRTTTTTARTTRRTRTTITRTRTTKAGQEQEHKQEQEQQTLIAICQDMFVSRLIDIAILCDGDPQKASIDLPAPQTCKFVITLVYLDLNLNLSTKMPSDLQEKYSN